MSIQARKEQEFTTNRDYEGNPTSQTVQYLVHDATTEEEAFATLKSIVPTYIGNLKLKTYELNEVKGGGAFTYDVNYEKSLSGNPDTPTVQEPRYSFHTSHAQAKMIRHKGEVWKSEGAKSLPGIHLTEEGYKGVDVAKANPLETLDLTVKRSKVTPDYKRTLIKMVHTVNKERFKGWEPGEVLFVGANISRYGDEDYNITFEFAISPNKKDIDLMGITIPEKKGWHYAWVIEKQKICDDKEILPVAQSAYVHKIFEESDFELLGIGT
ncbi:MAG: hypothetical protein PHV59_03225 [Victivallales bacterium]|nr:hypothetical protein [Victivallales bacterium]